MKSDLGMIAVIVILLIVAIVAGPLATIWAINTLFPALAIPYNIATWAAVIILGSVLKANVTVKK
jgi:hypothetical protein